MECRYLTQMMLAVLLAMFFVNVLSETSTAEPDSTSEGTTVEPYENTTMNNDTDVSGASGVAFSAGAMFFGSLFSLFL